MPLSSASAKNSDRVSMIGTWTTRNRATRTIPDRKTGSVSARLSLAKPANETPPISCCLKNDR